MIDDDEVMSVTKKSHYRVLGIRRNAGTAGVRSAYLRLVKDLHPDHSGGASSDDFRAVQEAYDVLSDPARRQAYDDELDGDRPVRPRQTIAVDRYRNIEPLIPEQRFAEQPWTGRSRVRSGIETLFEELLERRERPHVVTEPSHRTADFELTVPAELAASGGEIGIELPVRQRCPVCSGTGITWPFGCRRCGQTGRVIVQRALRLTVPQGSRSGTVVRIEPPHCRPLTIRIEVDQRWRSPPGW